MQHEPPPQRQHAGGAAATSVAGCERRVSLVAPREPRLDSRADFPRRSVDAERELREAERHVVVRVVGDEPLEVVRLDADRPLDLARVTADLGAPPLEHLHLRLELRGLVREGGVPGVGVLRDEPQRDALARARDEDR